MYCKNSTNVNSTTTHVVNYKNCIIVIKNVPCLEFEQCGEKYYTDEVVIRLQPWSGEGADAPLSFGTGVAYKNPLDFYKQLKNMKNIQ